MKTMTDIPITAPAGQRTYAAQHSRALCEAGHPEIVEMGEDLGGAENTVNSLYDMYLTIIAQRWHCTHGYKIGVKSYEDILTHGLYVPLSKRHVFSGQIDVLNDHLPDYCGVPWLGGGDQPMLVTMRRQRFPKGRGVVRPCSGIEVEVGVSMNRALSYTDTSEVDRLFSTQVIHAVVKENGHVIPAVYTNGGDIYGKAFRKAGILLSAICSANLWMDRKFVWNVRTEELLYDRAMWKTPTPIILGVDEEHIKSLFYSRSLPVTAAGRKRPILHWVEAHRRRLKAGTDIDVVKHLRGTDKFEMGGFSFAITNPVKPSAKRAA